MVIYEKIHIFKNSIMIRLLLFKMLFIAQLSIMHAAVPPVQKCSLSDLECMKSSAQAFVPLISDGIPELGIEPLDVMKVDKIKIDLAGLNLAVKDIDAKGLKKSVIESIKLDMVKKHLHLVLHTDMTVKGKYKASGMLLILPISGDGDLTIKLKEIQLDMTVPFDVIKNENGKDVVDLKSFTFKHDVKRGAYFNLTNLFNGNKELSTAMLTFMNQSWQALSQEFGGPMLQIPVHKIFEALKTYLRSQPLEEISV